MINVIDYKIVSMLSHYFIINAKLESEIGRERERERRRKRERRVAAAMRAPPPGPVFRTYIHKPSRVYAQPLLLLLRRSPSIAVRTDADADVQRNRSPTKRAQ